MQLHAIKLLMLIVNTSASVS